MIQVPPLTLSYAILKSISTQASQAGSDRTSSLPRVSKWKWLEHASVLGLQAALSPYRSETELPFTGANHLATLVATEVRK